MNYYPSVARWTCTDFTYNDLSVLAVVDPVCVYRPVLCVELAPAGVDKNHHAFLDPSEIGLEVIYVLDTQAVVDVELTLELNVECYHAAGLVLNEEHIFNRPLPSFTRRYYPTYPKTITIFLGRP